MVRHHALKSTTTLAETVQRLPSYLRTPFYKYSKAILNDTRALNLLEFEKWLQITFHQYFNPIANVVKSQENCHCTSQHQNDPTQNNFVRTRSNSNSALKYWLFSVAHKLSVYNILPIPKALVEYKIDSTSREIFKTH